MLSLLFKCRNSNETSLVKKYCAIYHHRFHYIVVMLGLTYNSWNANKQIWEVLLHTSTYLYITLNFDGELWIALNIKAAFFTWRLVNVLRLKLTQREIQNFPSVLNVMLSLPAVYVHLRLLFKVKYLTLISTNRSQINHPHYKLS